MIYHPNGPNEEGEHLPNRTRHDRSLSEADPGFSPALTNLRRFVNKSVDKSPRNRRIQSISIPSRRLRPFGNRSDQQRDRNENHRDIEVTYTSSLSFDNKENHIENTIHTQGNIIPIEPIRPDAHEVDTKCLEQSDRTDSTLKRQLPLHSAQNTILTAEKDPQRNYLKRKAKEGVHYRGCTSQLQKRKGPLNMSTFEQYNNYQQEASGANKFITSKGHHVPEGYHASSNDNRQQLHDIASSMASLCNIGNSCYMNSVIYTLRFAPLFLHNLHHLVDDISQINSRKESQMKAKSSSLGRNIGGLQGQSARSYSSKDLASLGSSAAPIDIPKTSQQIATEKLHDLFQNLHRNESTDSLEPYQSDNFLKSIQDVNPIFEGNQQQDAHEFLMCILDMIRETCQALTKVIIDHPEIIING